MLGRAKKISIVMGGYAASLAAGTLAAWFYDVRMAQMPYDTSGGMYAGGEAMTWFAVFLVAALFPTLLALWWLRGNTTFWNAIAAASIGFAALGLVAVLTFTLGDSSLTRQEGFVILGVFGLMQLLGVPFWFVAFALFAFLAPTPQARRAMKVAVAIEAVIGVVAFLHWFVPMARL